jgi:hypothetical protein
VKPEGGRQKFVPEMYSIKQESESRIQNSEEKNFCQSGSQPLTLSSESWVLGPGSWVLGPGS